MMVPILFPLQPRQSSPSSETCQLISCKSWGFAENRCLAALFLHVSITQWMSDSNTTKALWIRAGDLQRKTFSLQTKIWDSVAGDVHSLCCGCPFWACMPALLAVISLPCKYMQRGCVSPRSAIADSSCSCFYPQSWISAGCQKTRGPAGPLCWNGTTTPRPRAVRGSGTAAAGATRTDLTRRKNVTKFVSLVSSTCVAGEGPGRSLAFPVWCKAVVSLLVVLGTPQQVLTINSIYPPSIPCTASHAHTHTKISFIFLFFIKPFQVTSTLVWWRRWEHRASDLSTDTSGTARSISCCHLAPIEAKGIDYLALYYFMLSTSEQTLKKAFCCMTYQYGAKLFVDWVLHVSGLYCIALTLPNIYLIADGCCVWTCL